MDTNLNKAFELYLIEYMNKAFPAQQWEAFNPIENPQHYDLWIEKMSTVQYDVISFAKKSEWTDGEIAPQMAGNNARLFDAVATINGKRDLVQIKAFSDTFAKKSEVAKNTVIIGDGVSATEGLALINVGSKMPLAERPTYWLLSAFKVKNGHIYYDLTDLVSVCEHTDAEHLSSFSDFLAETDYEGVDESDFVATPLARLCAKRYKGSFRPSSVRCRISCSYIDWKGAKEIRRPDQTGKKFKFSIKR